MYIYVGLCFSAIQKEKMKKYIPLTLVLVAAAFAAFGLFTRRFIPTHDGEYHIIRFWQFYKMLSVGDLFPRWAPDLNSGYGLPLFIFHYPFPNYIGAFFHVFGIGFVDAFKLVLATGYLSAVIWCFLWLRSIRSSFVAVCSTIIFAFVPYWFVDIYVRGSVGEVWAIAFVLLTLLSVERGWPKVVALAVAGIILSHNITALFSLPIVCIYIFYRAKQYSWSVVFGIAVASYFWIPALFESNYMVGLNSVNFTDHFPDLYQLLVPSWGTGFSGRSVRFDQMSFQIGIVPMIIFFLSLLLLFVGKIKDRVLLVSIVLWGSVFYCMTVGSIWLWNLMPIAQFIQYPWRLLALLLILTPWLVANISEKMPKWASFLLVVFAVWAALGYIHPVSYAPRSDGHYLADPNFTDGTSSLGNSLSSRWSGWKRTRFSQRFIFDSSTIAVSRVVELPNYYRLLTRVDQDTDMTANILYFPGWKVLADNLSLPITYESDGIIHAKIPKGTRKIEVEFGETPLRRAADALSIVGLFCVFGSGILAWVYAYSLKQFTTFDRSQSSRRGNIHKRTHRRPSKRSKHHSDNV